MDLQERQSSLWSELEGILRMLDVNKQIWFLEKFIDESRKFLSGEDVSLTLFLQSFSFRFSRGWKWEKIGKTEKRKEEEAKEDSYNWWWEGGWGWSWRWEKNGRKSWGFEARRKCRNTEPPIECRFTNTELQTFANYNRSLAKNWLFGKPPSRRQGERGRGKHNFRKHGHWNEVDEVLEKFQKEPAGDGEDATKLGEKGNWKWRQGSWTSRANAEKGEIWCL